MRPLVLNPLFASLTSLPGVGPKLEKLYARLLDREAPRVVDLLFHLPVRRHRPPRAAEAQRGAARPGGHRGGDGRRAPAGAAATARARPIASSPATIPDDADADLFQRAQGLPGKALPVGETRYVSGTAEFYDGMLQMVHPDRVVDETRLRQPAAGRAGLSADRRAWRSAMCGARWTARWRACPICRNGRTRPGSRASAFPLLPPRCAICTGRPSRTTSRRRVWPGRGSPMTNCSPASSRSLWCARICAGRPAAARPAKAACARAS